MDIRQPDLSAASASLQRLFEQGVDLHQEGQFAQAEALYEQVLKIQPQHLDAIHLLGILSAQTMNFQRAEKLFKKAIELDPGNAAAYNDLGIVLHELKAFDAALESYGQAIALQPDYADAYNNRGNVLQELKDWNSALESYNRAIALHPDFAGAYYNRGLVLYELKAFDSALKSYDQAIALRPNYAEAYYNRGNILHELKKLDLALESYGRAIALSPDYAKAFSSRGAVLKDLKALPLALESCEKAIALQPDNADAYNNRGIVLHELKELRTALESYDRAIALRPDDAGAYYNRGIVLHELKDLQAALRSYDRAVALRPDYAEAYNNRGIVLHELKDLPAALRNYDRAIALKADYAEAYYGRGNVLHDLDRLDSALRSYDRALALKPDFEFLYEVRLHTKMCLCDWDEFDAQWDELEHKILCGEKAALTFPLLAMKDAPALQRKAAELYAQRKCPVNPSLGAISRRPQRGKIRIGYFSADFHNHATAYLMAELFERHDRAKFEVSAFSFGPDRKDEMRRRLVSSFDQFIDVRGKSDEQIAACARERGIDIAVDLKGYTKDSRPGIFACRAAPIQVSYLGYPGTMGAEYMDYLIADKTLIPPENQPYYSEKIVYLPDTYQVNDRKRALSDRQFSREESGLPRTGFVFCCFNSTYKITPASFAGWMRILMAVDGSVLWLMADHSTAAANLKREANLRGVDPERLIFAGRMPLSEHLARHRLADLFIDTFPCNAHTTASDALWAGLPVLTSLGESFASRVAASLLKAVHLPELIARSQEDYERAAIKLAADRAKLGEIRKTLANHRLTAPLFDTPLFTRHLEAAYGEMYHRYQAGAPLEPIEVQDPVR